ncbi:FAD-dependent oxidoreductase [Nocardia sp. NPDC052316]|uniref:FAD-dependent oxidoreductase n=1 Tax=Nocardia sp. NPDC052316 TaxID=3364329 RepID=UPI0037C629F1
MTPTGHAVVVGGGYAGLVAARVLADHCQRVTIVERDAITDAPAYRRGTPQCRHPHGLLARGAQILEQLFPGLREELASRGAPISDFGRLPLRFPTGWSPSVQTGLAVQTFSRTLLESSIRKRVLARPNVTMRDRTPTTGLVRAATRISGVELDGDRQISADLVVIATGRHSQLPTWLVDAGLSTPRTLQVDGRLSYTSRLYHRSTGVRWHMSIQSTFAPTTRRGGVVNALEDNSWIVCLFGADGEMAPTEPDGFTAYAESLANPYITEVVRDAAPASAIYRYAGLGGHWHRYDRLHDWPDGLAVLGDALCSLNPVYGHGMTIAAEQALLLGRSLHQFGNGAGCHRFQRRTRRTILIPWILSTSLDQGWDPRRAPLTATLANKYMLNLLERIPENPDLYRKFLNVQHMMSSPLVLLQP